MHMKKMPAARFLLFVFVLCVGIAFGFADDAWAAKKKSSSSKSAENSRYSAIVVDAQTGEVLMARYADSIRYPASLTKMMTLYMVFEALEARKLRMSDRIPISKHAASMSPSKLGIPAGSSIRVDDAIRALVTKSANDVSAAIAEKLGGSERNFAARMTKRARDLGMSRTTFRNASGLPDPQQVTTARDMAKLAMALLRDFPNHYHYFGVRNFEYRGVNHHNHNRLLGEYQGLDGIKTGYINASGFNLVASAKQNGRRLVGVVFGGRTWRSRNTHMVKLLDEGFVELGKRRSRVMTASAPIPLPPPMTDDDIRGVEAATLVTRADETDSAEEAIAYTPEDARKITAMIDRVQDGDADEGSIIQAAPLRPVERQAGTTSVPIPQMRPDLDLDPAAGPTTTTIVKTVAMAPVGVPKPTQPSNAARTVMQLRIPASQLPKGMVPPGNASVGGTSVPAPSTARGWSIQVGAFASRAMTDQALRTAVSRLPSHLQGAQPVIVPQSTGNGLIFRARLQGYDELQANAACAHLNSCLVVAPGS